MYRFLASPRWLGYAALTVVLAVVMVELGFWQLDRYRERSGINARIDASARAEPLPLERVLAAPPRPAGGATGPVAVGRAPSKAAAWTRVVVTGRYDTDHEILVRSRTVSDSVGFEVVTPLVLDDGTAVLVDRGWVPPAEGGATALPRVPAAPGGTVRVVGRVHLPESRADAVESRGGRLEARRIAPRRAAAVLPYPLYGAYLMLQTQDPPGGSGFVAVPPPRENALQNGGYVIQWWLFAAIVVIGYGYLAYREAHGGFDRGDRLDPDGPSTPNEPRTPHEPHTSDGAGAPA